MVQFQHDTIQIHNYEQFDGIEYVTKKHRDINHRIYSVTAFKKILKNSKSTFLDSEKGWFYISDELYDLLVNKATSGIPDLIVFNCDGSFKLIEVKNPGDSLSINQMKFYSQHPELEIIVYSFTLHYFEALC